MTTRAVVDLDLEAVQRHTVLVTGGGVQPTERPRDTPRPNVVSNTCSGYCASTGTTPSEVVHSVRHS